MTSISPTQSDVQTALRSFLLTVLPANVDVIEAVDNRVPEPQFPSFVVMSILRFARIETNIDTSADVKFTGSIVPATASITGSIAPSPPQPGVNPSGVLTVTAVGSGTLVAGGMLTGAAVLTGTQIAYQISGTAGGIGVYAVNLSQTVPSTTISETYGLMTVSAVAIGMLSPGAIVNAVGVAAFTQIQSQLTGSEGAAGTYVVTPSQTVSAGTLSAGAKTMQQNAMVSVQLDFHAADTSASDMAQAVSTAFRDSYGVDYFNNLDPPLNSITPLYADDPRYMPFVNDQGQSEWRWVLDAELQANQVISVPQQYADAVTPTLISVDAVYPPA